LAITSTRKLPQLDKTDLSRIAATLSCGSDQEDALNEKLRRLNARFLHVSSTGELAPLRESKALSLIDKAIERYLNADTDSKHVTASKKLSGELSDYISKYGEHRKWLARAIDSLIATNKIDPTTRDRLTDKIHALKVQPTGNLEYSYLVEELLSIYEDFSDRDAVVENKWLDKKNYRSTLDFLIATLPYFIPSENISNSRAIEKQIVRYYERLINRQPPIIR